MGTAHLVPIWLTDLPIYPSGTNVVPLSDFHWEISLIGERIVVSDGHDIEKHDIRYFDIIEK